MKKNLKNYSLDHCLDFGKYIDTEVENVIIHDPKYILWALKNVDNFSLNKRADDLLQDICDDEGIRYDR